MERSIDTNKFNNIGQFISSLEFGKYAATLRNSSIMASGSNYIVVCVSSEIFAKQINEFELNYGYEDFIRGFKPDLDGNFRLKDGIFYSICERARKDEENNYYIIIGSSVYIYLIYHFFQRYFNAFK